MNSNDKFNIRRAAMLLRHDLMEQRRNLILGAGTAIGFLILIAAMICRNLSDNVTYSAPLALTMLIPLIGTWIAIVMAVAGSKTFSSMRNKPGRIATMMLPATPGEKFAVGVTIYTVIADIVFIAGILVTLLVVWVLTSVPPTRILADIMPSSLHQWEMATVSCLWLLISQAIYTLGSAIWPRHSFLKTFGALFALMLTWMFFIPSISLEWLTDMLSRFDWENISEHVIFAITIVAEIGQIIIIYAFAYCRFRRMQLCQRFIMN